MSSIVNKVKEMVHPDRSSQASGTHNRRGQTGSSAGAAEPRAADTPATLDSQAAPGAYGAGPEYTTSDNYTHGTGATSGAGFGTGPAPNTAGPHGSDTVNQADPRVDSDLDGSRNMGMNSGSDSGIGSGSGAATGATTTGMGMGTDTRNFGAADNTTGLGRTSQYDNDTNTAGMTGGGGATGGISHTSGAMPYDRDNTNTTGMTGTNTSGMPYGDASNTTSSGTTGRNGFDSTSAYQNDNTTGTTRSAYNNTTLSAASTGPAPNTAGPHKSDALNKMDPRVDSNLDGSRTVGSNNQTSAYQGQGQQGASLANRDPTDAAQVPPSVMRRHMGDPSIEHGDHLHNRERRNSTATHQETFRGI